MRQFTKPHELAMNCRIYDPGKSQVSGQCGQAHSEPSGNRRQAGRASSASSAASAWAASTRPPCRGGSGWLRAAYPDPLPGVDPPCSTTGSFRRGTTFRRGAIGAIEGHETNTIDCDGCPGYLGADGGRVHAALGQRWADVHSCRSRIAITGLHLRSWLPLGRLPWSMRA